MRKNIFFDLDGTLTDSGEGIINCAKMTLARFGLPVPNEYELRVFVGPPLDETLVQFGIPADRADEAVQVFRSRYLTVGKFENKPYEGIQQTLQMLCDQGYKLYVATSKPEITAVEIMDKFDLSKYFVRICGASMDKSRSSKSAVIEYLLQTGVDAADSIMIGDTEFDVLGAAYHDIPTIGVAWGYGLVENMINAGANAIAYSMKDLISLINAI